MRKPIFAVVLVFTALAAVGNIGFKLAGAMRQVGALAGVNAAPTVSAADPERSRAAERAEFVPVASPEPSAGAVVERPAPTAEPSASASESPLRFDAETASREAGDRDPSVAELLNDPDPAVGSAVRDFITSLATPGGN